MSGQAPAPRRVFLSMGSNVGDRRRLLAEAVESLGDVVTATSPVYETDPVGGPEQGRFLNIVVELHTASDPRELLAICHRLESAAGRVRQERWGPRTLDVDIIWIDGETVDEPDLEVPHPRMWQRRFVLRPLADLAPDLVPDDVLAHAEGTVDLVGPWAEMDLPAAGDPPG
ncbi:MAG: 2-amino-4-hydroxy-6-hydroxymethyldihydropteridine diphosphokinase [Acidimicrobiales bacterium]|nr:2-amino-4-hydroxy-6-hydroxymethyldihydropteridine diphosphokinase [Acidimicrobiales bacterium]